MRVANVTVWKCENDPVVQMGWAAREVRNVTIAGLAVVHARYWGAAGLPTAIFGASGFYDPSAKVGSGYHFVRSCLFDWCCF